MSKAMQRLLNLLGSANLAPVEFPLHMRYMIRRDMKAVLTIAELCGIETNEFDLCRTLREHHTIGVVGEINGVVIAYTVYELHKHYLQLVQLCVHPMMQHEKVGTEVMDKLKNKLGEKRTRIYCDMHERNLPGLLWLKSKGFRAVGQERDAYPDGDCITMEFRRENCCGR